MTDNQSKLNGTLNQVQITIIAGIGLNKHRQPISEAVADKACRSAAEMITIKLGGCTVREVKGLYRHDDGGIAVEPSVEFVVVMPQGAANCGHILAVAEFLKRELEQECVAIITQPAVSMAFI